MASTAEGMVEVLVVGTAKVVARGGATMAVASPVAAPVVEARGVEGARVETTAVAGREAEVVVAWD